MTSQTNLMDLLIVQQIRESAGFIERINAACPSLIEQQISRLYEPTNRIGIQQKPVGTDSLISRKSSHIGNALCGYD